MKFKKVFIINILLVFLILFLVFLSEKKQKTEIEISDRKLQVEISRTEKERDRGLSGRESICENCGMLFVFPEEGRRGFWMKEMKFDLDIIWISQGKITYIAKNVSCDLKETIIPETDADKVLELNAGMADELGIKEGDEIRF